jgi:exopolysaccharide production protein ExoQ
MTLASRNIVIMLAFAAAATVAVVLLFEPSAFWTIAVFPGVAFFLTIVYGVLTGDRFATLLHLFAASFLMHSVFRVRDYADKDVDFQVIIKIALWVTVAGVALIHGRKWIGLVLQPVNLPWILFLFWMMATATISPNPTYTLVSAFTVCASVLFCAYMFSVFDAVDVFATILLATIVFCIVSIIVYFVVPEFGHYVYWVNQERYVSPRLSGIAGTANNMALIAAFGVVVTGLYAREFHQMNRFLVPLSVVFCGAALVMTNSRTPLAMAVVILLATYLLSWRRLYAALFLVSVALLMLYAVMPFGQEFLLKSVSRSGDVGEVTSMTGRSAIWYVVLKLIELQPITGYGYASSVFILPQHVNEVGFPTSHAHNLFLQLLFTTGWIGLILFVLAIIGVIVRAALHRDATTFCMTAFVLLNGITESSGFTTLANMCTLAFAIAVTYPSMQREYSHDLAYQR